MLLKCFIKTLETPDLSRMHTNIKAIFGLCCLWAVAVDSFRPSSFSLDSRVQIKSSFSALSSLPSNDGMNKIELKQKATKFLKGSVLAFFAAVQMASARPEGVNRPDLLPKELNVPLIDVANFLSKGQEKKITASIVDLQKVTGWKFRILCQR